MFRNLFLSLSRIPPFVMVLIIFGFGAMAAVVYMQQQSGKDAEIQRIKQAAEAEKKQTATVVMASKQIEEGETFSSENTKVEEIPSGTLPKGAVQSQAALQGYVAKLSIQPDQVILDSFIRTTQQQAKGFDGKIKEGMRAVTFAIDTNSGVAGFIYPESHVDILCIAGTGPDVKAAPVLSDVEVIAVGGTYDRPKGSDTQALTASSVTVLLNPDDAEKLVKAVTAGRPYLVLRNSKDHTPVATVDIAALFPKPKVETEGELASGGSLPAPSLPPPPLPGGGGLGGGPVDAGPPPPPPMHEIELWSGSKKEVLSVPQG